MLVKDFCNLPFFNFKLRQFLSSPRLNDLEKETLYFYRVPASERQ